MLDLIRKARFLDPKLFTAFAAAAEVRNFTHAARVANMTQSGISQHIAKLEEQIDKPLFKRIGKQVILTDGGRLLLKYLREHVADLDNLFERIHEEDASLSGMVAYAMPPSCLFSTHFPDLLARRATEKHLRLKIVLAAAPEALDLVVQDRVDFAFMTARPEHPAVTFERFCDEEYILVGADQLLMNRLPSSEIFEQPIVGYPGADTYFNAWIRHHAPDESRDYHSLIRAGEINAIEGAITMVVGGVGCAVFPRHCVQRQLEAGRLFEYRAGNPTALHDRVYVARIAGIRPSRRVKQVLDWFYELLGEQAPTWEPEKRTSVGL